MERDRGDQVIRILLVEDDEDDYVIIRDVLSQIQGHSFQLDWVSTYEDALDRAASNSHDICLMDYRLGEHDGIQLTRNFLRHGFQAPIILLTGLGSQEVDMQAMREGAADYLEKIDLGPELLERSIRYAIDHSKTLAALRESEQKLRLLSAKLLEAQENERKIIAQELHDSVGASLSAVRYGLEEKLHRMGKDNSPPEGISLEQIKGIVVETIEEIHRISSNLRPSTLDDMGLLPAVRSVCRELQEVHKGIQIETRLDAREEEVPEPLKIVIYRILQEALNNVFKHSQADTARVTLKKIGKTLELTVGDNGRGFAAEKRLSQGERTGGMGLLGMKERVELSNGSFRILSGEGKGTTLQAEWGVD